MPHRLLSIDALRNELPDENGRPLSRNAAYNIVASGMIRHVRTGTGRNARILIPEDAVAEFLAGQRPQSLVASIGTRDAT